MAEKKRLMTKAAFARELEVSKAAVSKYVAAGMPVEPDGRVDAEKCMRFLGKHLDTGRSMVAPKVAKLGAAAKRANEPFRRARAERTRFQARTLKLVYEERRESLLDRREVEVAMAQTYAEFKTRMMTLPDRIVKGLRELPDAGCRDAQEVRALINTEIRKALQEFADAN